MDWNDADDTGWKVTHYQEAIALLQQGLGYGWLPRHLANAALADGSLVALTLEGEANATSIPTC